MKKRVLFAYAGAIFVNIMWGLSVIWSQRSMKAGLTPFALISVRFIAACLLLLPVALIRKENLKVRLKDMPLMLLSSLTGVTVYFIFELNGLKRTNASTAALIVALVPLLTMAYSVLFKHKKVKPLVWLFALCSIGGVYLVVSSDGGSDTAGGVMFMLCAVVSWVIYMELTDKLMQRYTNLSVTCWQSVFGVITALPFAFTENVKLASVTKDGWLCSFVFLGIICSAVCYILYNNAIQELSPVHTAVFLNLNPVAAMIGSVLLQGVPLKPEFVIGGAIVILSLYLITRFGSVGK